MANKSNYTENKEVDSTFRGGALNAAGTVNSTAVVTGVWTASTAYTAGQVVVPHANMTGAGGKFLLCTTGGTTGSTNTLAVPAVGTTLTDNTVTWTAISGSPSLLSANLALFVINKGLRASSTAYNANDCISLTAQGGAGGNNAQHLYYASTAGTSASAQPQYNGVPGESITDGTAVFTELSLIIQSNTGYPSGLAEVSGGSYARIALAQSLANMSGTQGAGSTSASSGTSGQTSNNNSATFAAPSGNWAASPTAIGLVELLDLAGNLIWWIPLTVPQQVLNGAPAPSYAAGSLAFIVDN